MDHPGNSIETVVWVGAGALGLLYAARLIRSGVRVHLLLRSDFDTAARQGIHVRSVDGDFHVPPTAFVPHRTPETLPPADLVVISTKTTANAELPTILAATVRKGTRLLTLQNGFGNEAFLAQAFPHARIYGGTAFVSVHRIAPAVADHQHSGRIAIGRYTHPNLPPALTIAPLTAPPPASPSASLTAPPVASPRYLPPALLPDPSLDTSDDPNRDCDTEELAAFLRRTGFEVDVLRSLLTGRWEKQLWNVPFNGLGAALNLDTEQLLATRAGEILTRVVMAEVAAVAALEGVVLSDALIDSKIAFTRKMGAYRTSMHLDRLAGRKMEVSAIVGTVYQKSIKFQIDTPHLRVLEIVLRAIDAQN